MWTGSGMGGGGGGGAAPFDYYSSSSSKRPRDSALDGWTAQQPHEQAAVHEAAVHGSSTSSQRRPNGERALRSIEQHSHSAPSSPSSAASEEVRRLLAPYTRLQQLRDQLHVKAPPPPPPSDSAQSEISAAVVQLHVNDLLFMASDDAVLDQL